MKKTTQNTLHFFVAMAAFVILFANTGNAQNCIDTTYTGTATFFTTGSTSSCNSPYAADSVHVAAMNIAQYDTSATCGACILITGPNGSATAIVNETCNTCPVNGLDLSMDLQPIIDSTPEIAHVQWKYVGCPVTGNVQIILNNSNPFYAQVRVMNHRYAIKKLEVLDSTGYTILPKRTDNYFIASSGLGNGPYSFRITDILGDTILETGVLLVNDSIMHASHQFPQCSEPNAIEQLLNTSSNMQVLNDPGKSNQFIIANHTPYAVYYIVYDVLGRIAAQGNVGSYAQQIVVTPTPGIYIVNYPQLESGRYAQKVVVK